MYIPMYMWMLIISSLYMQCSSMIAYDCAGRDMNITSISLLDTTACPTYRTSSVTDSIDIQVLQERETYDVHVYKCLVEIDYHVTHCGMHSHASEVSDGWGTMIQELTPSECINMHKEQVGTVYGQKVTGLKRNNTLVTSLILAGSATLEGDCTGGTLNLGNFHWKNVYGVAKTRITLSDSMGLHRIDDGQVLLNSGLSCKYSDGFCIDTREGYVTWETVNKEDCARDSYIVLYRGRASKVTVQSTVSSDDIYTLYSIKDGKFLATMTQKNEKTLCGINVYTTDHPKLLVHEIRGGSPYFIQNPLTTSNMDVFLYVNAKFTHIENHLRRELTTMYESMIKQQCETQKEVLKTQLSLAIIDPVEFAYTYMKSPGYTGIVMGEQIHVIKCNPVFVTARKIEECFNELPVNYTGRPMFMSPRSHILQKTGTPVACSVLMQPAFQLSGSWFVSSNGLTKTTVPSSLSPSSKMSWTYTDAGELATQGIYTSEDLDKLRSQMMYPSERRAITQTVSAAINQDTYISDRSFFSNLITKETVEKSFHSFVHDTWAGFLTFGNFFSGVFGMMLLAKVIKWAFDTVIHSKGLYEVYGCGWQILGAAWDAVTTYLLSPVKVQKHYESTRLSDTKSTPITLEMTQSATQPLYPVIQQKQDEVVTLKPHPDLTNPANYTDPEDQNKIRHFWSSSRK